MKVKVTWDDIRNGARMHPDRCPVALAIKRTFKADMVLVSSTEAIIYSERLGLLRRFFKPKQEKKEKHYSLPQHVKDFIATYDSRLSSQPIEFEL